MKRSLYILLLLCTGIVVGSLVAELTSSVPYLKWLGFGLNFGLTTPFVLDLGVLTLTFGIAIDLTVSVIIFVLLSLFIGLSIVRRR